jgi:hypothetical protein
MLCYGAFIIGSPLLLLSTILNRMTIGPNPLNIYKNYPQYVGLKTAV